MKPHIKYEFHHIGIPSTLVRPHERYSEATGMYTADNPGSFRIQWHRFKPDSPLHPLLRTIPHPAFKVANLREAILGEELLLGPYEPLDGYFVAVINDNGVPIELIQTEFSDEELWGRAVARQGSLYRNAKFMVMK